MWMMWIIMLVFLQMSTDSWSMTFDTSPLNALSGFDLVFTNSWCCLFMMFILSCSCSCSSSVAHLGGINSLPTGFICLVSPLLCWTCTSRMVTSECCYFVFSILWVFCVYCVFFCLLSCPCLCWFIHGSPAPFSFVSCSPEFLCSGSSQLHLPAYLPATLVIPSTLPSSTVNHLLTTSCLRYLHLGPCFTIRTIKLCYVFAISPMNYKLKTLAKCSDNWAC